MCLAFPSSTASDLAHISPSIRSRHTAAVRSMPDRSWLGGEFPIVRLKGVACENLVTPPRRTREPHHRDGRDGEHEPRQPLKRPTRVLARVARETVLDGADVRRSGSQTDREQAQGAVGSESASSRDIPGGPCEQTARPRRWLAARETACEGACWSMKTRRTSSRIASAVERAHALLRSAMMR